MRRFRGVLLVVGWLGACSALPSAVPLADTGEGRALEDGALSRNRVPLAARGLGDDDGDDEPSDTVEVVASSSAVPDAGDAGVPEGGTAEGNEAGLHWAGEYFGSDKQTTSLEGKPEKVDLDDKAHTRVEEPSAGIVLITLVSSGNGEVICAMRAKVQGKSAELEPGVSCPALYMMPPLTIEGGATLDGDALEFHAHAHGEFPSDDDPLSVDVDYTFEGKRR